MSAPQQPRQASTLRAVAVALRSNPGLFIGVAGDAALAVLSLLALWFGIFTTGMRRVFLLELLATGTTALMFVPDLLASWLKYAGRRIRTLSVNDFKAFSLLMIGLGMLVALGGVGIPMAVGQFGWPPVLWFLGLLVHRFVGVRTDQSGRQADMLIITVVMLLVLLFWGSLFGVLAPTLAERLVDQPGAVFLAAFLYFAWMAWLGWTLDSGAHPADEPHRRRPRRRTGAGGR